MMKASTSLLFLEVATFVFSAFTMPAPAHLESLAPEVSLAQLSETKTRLRGQGVVSPAALVEAKSSMEDAVPPPLDFLNTTGSKNKPNQGLEDEVKMLFKMRKKMGKEAFDATPFKGSVNKILKLIEEVMMVKVEAAHKNNQIELYKIANSTFECGSTKDSQVEKANETRVLYEKKSPEHFSCRQTESGDRTIQESCWEEESDKKTVKNLACTAFDIVGKAQGDENAQRQVMKKTGSESTSTYVDRITSTICGGCKGTVCRMMGANFEHKKCNGEPYSCGCGAKCKYLKAKDECDVATADWKKHKKNVPGQRQNLQRHAQELRQPSGPDG